MVGKHTRILPVIAQHTAGCLLCLLTLLKRRNPIPSSFTQYLESFSVNDYKMCVNGCLVVFKINVNTAIMIFSFESGASSSLI